MSSPSRSRAQSLRPRRGRIGPEGRLRFADHGQRLVVDDHSSSPIFSIGARFADDDGDGMPTPPDFLLSQGESARVRVSVWAIPNVSAVKTATTPGMDSAGEESICTIRACAYGLKTRRACSSPGKV